MSKRRTTNVVRLVPRAPKLRLSPGERKRPSEPSEGMRERIAGKAYQLWEARGRRAGGDLEDWLDAETAVREELHDARG